MTTGEALRWLTDRALIAANGLASENVSRVSDELHDALAAKDAELNEYRTQVAIAFGYDGPLGPAMFSIVEAVAAKDAEIARLTMKNEQYATQLDDRWAGVVGVTNKAVGELAALRVQVAALTEQRDRLMAALARWPMSSEYEALRMAHAALRASITTGVTCLCRRYEYIGTRVCWRCAALADAPGPP